MGQMPDVRQFALGVEGLGLLREWLTGDDTIIARRINEIRQVVNVNVGAAAPITIPEQELERGYAAWAATYDAPGNPFIEVEQPAVHELLAGLPRGRVLDAAAGTGRHTAYLQSQGHQVVAVDATDQMLAQLQAHSPEAEIRKGDLRALPLPTASVDAAVCSLALTHLTDLVQPIAELARVVRPGGQIVLSDIHPFAVFLGSQAAYTGADGTRGFVRNYLHLPSAYLAAFQAVGLEVGGCWEPTLRAEHAPLLATATLRTLPFLKDSLASAIDGLPAILIWQLTRI